MLIMNLLFIYLIEKIENSIFTGIYTLYSKRNYVMKIRDLIKGLTYFLLSQLFTCRFNDKYVFF